MLESIFWYGCRPAHNFIKIRIRHFSLPTKFSKILKTFFAEHLLEIASDSFGKIPWLLKFWLTNGSLRIIQNLRRTIDYLYQPFAYVTILLNILQNKIQGLLYSTILIWNRWRNDTFSFFMIKMKYFAAIPNSSFILPPISMSDKMNRELCWSL